MLSHHLSIIAVMNQLVCHHFPLGDYCFHEKTCS